MRMFLPPRILLMRRELYAQAEWTPESSDCVKAHGLDLDCINAHTGLFAVCLCQIAGPNFDFFPDGVPAAVIEVLAEDGATVVDLVAWPLDAPDRFATACGEADILGIANMRNPATYAGGKPLAIHRTPLAWLKAGCSGCVVLNAAWGGVWLSRATGPLLAEDLAHGRELRRVMPKGFDTRRLLVPLDSMRRAA